MCLLHNFMQSSLCILTKEQIRIVKFNANFLATMLKINTQIPTGCRNNAQSTQSQRKEKRKGRALAAKAGQMQRPAVSCCFCVSRRSSLISCSTIYRWEPQSSFRSRIINSPRASSAATGAALPFFFPLSWFAWVPPLSFSSFYEFAFLFPSRNCDNIGRVCDNILCIASKYQLSFSFSVGQFYIDFTSA